MNHGLSLLVVLGLFSTFSIARGQNPDIKMQLAELVPALRAEKIQDRKQAMEKWQAICLRASANETQRRKACSLMSNLLDEKSPEHATVFLLRQLERIGNEESVPAIRIAIAQKNPRIQDAARRALTANPSAEAARAIHRILQNSRKGLNFARPDFLVGLVNSLGYRADPSSVKVLENLLANKNKQLSAAAWRAIAKIDDPSAEKAIIQNFEKNQKYLPAAEAYLATAERQLKKGNRQRAAIRFEKLADTKYQSSIRLAIATGRLQTSGKLDKKPYELAEEYFSQKDDPQLQRVAANYLPKLSDEGLKTIAARCHKFPKSGQLQFLNRIGSTRNQVALAPVLKLCKSEDAEIGKAAILALSGLASEKTVPFLVETMMKGGDRGEAAARSLERVFADGVDQRIAKLMLAENDSEKRKRFLQILDRRRAVSEINAIVDQCQHADKSVRQLAFKISSRLGSPKEISKLAKIHSANKDRGERDEIEKSIVTICRRIPSVDRQADPVISIYKNANRESQIALLPLLGRLGGKNALELVRAAVKDKNERFVEAGVTALANWPNANVTDDLIRVSTHSNQSLRIRSVRALARVVVLRDGRSDAKRLDLLKTTMKKAERDQERDLILDRAKAIRTIESLRFVAPYLDSESLKQRACRTIVDLAHHRGLRQPNQEEFNKALSRVIEITSDRRTAERARNYMKK